MQSRKLPRCERHGPSLRPMTHAARAFRVGVIFVVALGLAIALGCSGPDAGTLTFSGGSGGSAGSTDETSGESDGDRSNAGDGGRGAGNSDGGGSRSPSGGGGAGVNQVFSAETYPAIAPACGTCHRSGTGNAPVFFGADASSSYPLFKQRNYHKANSVFVTKGAHRGPPLTTSQRAAVDKWVGSEGG
jgi:hypothetical protein